MNPEEITYTQAVERLEAILARMQSNDCDIDSLSKYTTEAMPLLKICREKLTRTDEEVRRCLEELRPE